MSPNIEAAINLVRDELAIDPTLIDRLAPGMMLVRRPMSPKQRAQTAIPAMNAAKKAYHLDMLAAIVPVVYRVRQLRPIASAHEIAAELNTTTYGPTKSRKEWTYADVRRLLKELSLELEPTAP